MTFLGLCRNQILSFHFLLLLIVEQWREKSITCNYTLTYKGKRFLECLSHSCKERLLNPKYNWHTFEEEKHYKQSLLDPLQNALFAKNKTKTFFCERIKKSHCIGFLSK